MMVTLAESGHPVFRAHCSEECSKSKAVKIVDPLLCLPRNDNNCFSHNYPSTEYLCRINSGKKNVAA